MPDTVENPDLAKPANLSAQGEQAYAAIVAYLHAHNVAAPVNTHGFAFYAPTTWRERGEEYGCNSELILVYEGSALRSLFSLDGALESYEHIRDSATYLVEEFPALAPLVEKTVAQGPYIAYERMVAAMAEAGFYVEECTRWYAAVYPR